jgi:hypothetical protein
MKILKVILILFLFCYFQTTNAQVRLLESFESTSGWLPFASEGVTIDTATVKGFDGNCIKIDFNFMTGAGYCGIQKQFPIQLSPNYKFSFYIKAEAPVNNFEFKLLDKSGDNVWWVNHRNFEFPTQWTKMTIKKRHISFAWGPTENRDLIAVDKIEFVVSSAAGGKGSLYIDQFEFEPLEVPAKSYPKLIVSASSNLSSKNKINKIFDNNQLTKWRSKIKPEQQSVTIDLQKYREYGGLIIDWDEHDFAQQYQVQISNDGKN